MAPRVVTEVPGEEYGLKDVLQRWGFDDLAAGVASRWRCEIAPHAETEAGVRECVLQGRPVTCNPAHAAEVHDRVGAGGGRRFVQEGPWGQFNRPKIAFRGGWGKPGEPLIDEKALHLVRSFKEVYELGDTPLNLQSFHRTAADEAAKAAAAAEEDSIGESAAEPDTPLPVLPDLLEWPLPEFFRVNAGDDDSPDAPCALVDRATRMSRRGAITWWHLDDCGEFVYQAGLAEPDLTPSLVGPCGKPVVKIFIFAEKDAYELITQDDATNATRSFCGLDLFETPDGALPQACVGEDDIPLPRFTLAILEAGGRPLLSPPNCAHLVITVDSCVMVEQRRVSKLFLDEVAYFQRRLQRWDDPPIQYQFVAIQLKDPGLANTNVIPLLLRLLGSSDDCNDNEPDTRNIAIRAFQSLVALRLMHPGHFESDGPGKEAAERVDRISSGAAAPAWFDIGAVQHREILMTMMKGKTGLFQLGDRVAAYVHENGCPRWGPLRSIEVAAIGDRLAMLDGIREGRLLPVIAELATMSDRAAESSIETEAPPPAVTVPPASIESSVSAAHSEVSFFD